jgi:hypothetical protein
MKWLSVVFGLLFVFVVSILWGGASVVYNFFPWTILKPVHKKIEAFLESHPDEPNSSVIKKLESDFGGVPYRFAQKLEDPYQESISDGKSFEISQDRIYLRGTYSGAPKGYILLFGVFLFENNRNKGTLLVSTEGKLAGAWAHDMALNVSPTVDLAHRLIFPAGDSVFSWGCDYTDFQRKVPVSEILLGHHSIGQAPDGTYWTINGKKENEVIAQYRLKIKKPGVLPEASDVEILKEIKMDSDIRLANSEISANTTQFSLVWDENNDPQKLHPIIGYNRDPFHGNDAEPFVDPRFPTDAGYALLVSIRQQNLILVLDPVTYRILWYRQGLTERQHDPDYTEKGIYVYNNRTFSGFSTIDFIPFESDGFGYFGHKIVVDGRKHDWFDPSRGQHQVILQDEKRFHLVTNDRNGRVMIFNQDDQMVFEMVNILGGQSDTSKRLQVRAAIFMTEEQVSRMQSECLK